MSILDYLIGCNRHPLSDQSALNSPYSQLKIYSEQNRLGMYQAIEQAKLAQAEHLRPLEKPYLNESRPLTGAFSDYVTQDTEPRYKCHSKGGPTSAIEFGPVKIKSDSRQEIFFSDGTSIKPGETKTYGVDIDQFRKDCEDIDEQTD